MQFSDKAVRALMSAHGTEVLPGEGKLIVPSTTLIVPTFTLSRGADTEYNKFPTGDLVLAAFAAIVGGDGLETRLANAFRKAIRDEIQSKHLALIENVKMVLAPEVKAPRRAALTIEV